ncbi:MAG: EAL domain-containing protein [Eubacteriales bacterium]|nr:EAL domain-containing protein [Eubacteriales bacterium]
MPSISLFEIIASIRKHGFVVVASMLICLIIGQAVVSTRQRYTATTVIEYSYSLAEEGKNPKGEKLDVYEINSPVVVEKVINGLGLNTSVERIRNSITITPLVDSTTKQKQKALTEKGEDFEYFPTRYIINFRYAGNLGHAYGQMVLNKLLSFYDDYFRQTYTGQRKIQDVFSNVNYDNYDYMEICELYDSQLSSILTLLSDLQEEAPEFRSSKTGLSFSDLSTYFGNLYSTDYNKLYSNVRVGLLSKNKELLVKKYQHKIEELTLLWAKKNDTSQLSYAILLDFYKQYKEGLAYNELGLDPGDTDETGDNIIREQDVGKIITTYDQIMTQYVDESVEASDAKNHISYYSMLMNDYINDNVPEDAKAVYTEKSQRLIEKIDSQIKNYIDLANETLSDYNRYKGTQYISFLSTAQSKPLLNRTIIWAFALAVGLFMGVFLVIAIEYIQRLKQQADAKQRIERIESLKEGVIPVDTSNLLQIERLLYEQAAKGFTDFMLYYQPILNTYGECVGAEALVRWYDKELGILMPDEFLPLAEKHDIMALLGEWILKTACNQCIEWNKDNENMWVAVNFTINQINSLKFMDGIYSALESTGVNTKNIMLEISNGGEIEDPQGIAKKIIAIKTFGVRVSIDNFGTENSAIEALYSLPVDVVKIDKSITAGINTNINSMNLVSTIINTASLVNYQVCAEGVETQEQFDKIASMGVDFVQGFYFAKPMPAEDFNKFLMEKAMV